LNVNKEIEPKITTLLTAMLICILAILLWIFIYHVDNKYTVKGPQGLNGVLTLDDDALSQHPVVFLVDGWEYYSGRLLTPKDFEQGTPLPDHYMFVGQFGGLEAGDATASPHGSASYRLRILLPAEIKTYKLDIPEIFSAYRLYINGDTAAGLGNPAPIDYVAETGNRTVSIQAGGSIELLIAVSDYSHFYSGMVYPPAFGEPQAVDALLNLRLFFRTMLCAAALTIGLLTLFIGLQSRKNILAILYGILCLLFVGYVSYPITTTLFTGTPIIYVIENVSFCAMLFVVMLIVRRMCKLMFRWCISFILFGAFICLAAVGPVLWKTGNLNIMLIYSYSISIYQWITALFITAAAVYGVLKDLINTKPLLYGVLIFDTALIVDRVLTLHEPIVTGWFIEMASFILVCFVGVTIGQETASRYRETTILEERAGNMERLYQRQQTYYNVLKQEVNESKRMRHDMRHHFNMIDGFLQNQQYNQLGSYVSEYKSSAILNSSKVYCPIGVINILSHHYDTLCQQNDIHLDIRYSMDTAQSDPAHVNMSDADLCCLFSNLMENAVESCLRAEKKTPCIRTAIVRPGPSQLYIRVWNDTDVNVKINGNNFVSSKEKGRQGYGLMSIRQIAEKYQGEASFSWNKTAREFESKIFLRV
jgi:hypothetical protein